MNATQTGSTEMDDDRLVSFNWSENLSDECKADWAAVAEENARRVLPEADRNPEALEGFKL